MNPNLRAGSVKRKTKVSGPYRVPLSRELDIFYAEYDNAANKSETIIQLFLNPEYSQTAKATVFGAITNPHWFAENEEEAFDEGTITAVTKWVYSNLMATSEVHKYFTSLVGLTPLLCEEVKKNTSVEWRVVERVLSVQTDISLSVLFINSLNESVFHPDFVEEIIDFLKNGPDWIKTPEVISALVDRIQPHLGIDKVVPASWVIKIL